MEIRILHTEVSNLNLRKLSLTDGGVLPSENEQSPIFRFKIVPLQEKEQPDVVGLLFQIKLTSSNEFDLDINYISWFKTSEPITESFLQSPFMEINAPAIAFPFIRSFISTFLLNAGYKPFFIPSINFIKLYEQKAKETSI